MPVWYNLQKQTSGLYNVNLPDRNFTAIIFCRMNPTSIQNTWDNVWNQTPDVYIHIDKNEPIEYLYAIKENEWQNGEWRYNPNLCKHPNANKTIWFCRLCSYLKAFFCYAHKLFLLWGCFTSNNKHS